MIVINLSLKLFSSRYYYYYSLVETYPFPLCILNTEKNILNLKYRERDQCTSKNVPQPPSK